MAQTKNCDGVGVRRFVGFEIELKFKNGSVVRFGDGILISNEKETHLWLGEKTENNKNLKITIGNKRVKNIPFDTKELIRATYKDIGNCTIETFFF